MTILDSIRVLDFSHVYFGPYTTMLLADMGADVVKVEPPWGDIARFYPPLFGGASRVFHYLDRNKRGLTLNLKDRRGIEIAIALAERSDVIVENYSPRVMDAFGVTSERIRELNPRAVYIRMPAFGLDGPWRDNVGFAQTMEQMSGMAWLTGHPDDQPRIMRGPCDPIAGMHGAFAALLGLRERAASGAGMLVESPMVEAAINCSTEMIAEWTAAGVELTRGGNRSRFAAHRGCIPRSVRRSGSRSPSSRTRNGLRSPT